MLHPTGCTMHRTIYDGGVIEHTTMEWIGAFFLVHAGFLFFSFARTICEIGLVAAAITAAEKIIYSRNNHSHIHTRKGCKVQIFNNRLAVGC